MKNKAIRFFSIQDNTAAKPNKEATKAATKAKPVKLEGYISATGKLTIPKKIFEQLDLTPDLATVKVGTDEGKRKLKTLYLFPADSQEGFELVKAAKSYSISLNYILKKGSIDYQQAKYSFVLIPFTNETGERGYSMKLASDALKPAYTGKPRGRKPKGID